MICAQALELFSPHLDNELPASTVHTLREHLNACAHCTHSFVTLRHSLAALRALPERAVVDLPVRVMQAMGHSPALVANNKPIVWSWHWRRTTTVLAATLACTASMALALHLPLTRNPMVALSPQLSEIESANATLVELNAKLTAEIASEQAHRAHGEIWINGTWRQRHEVLSTLTAEQGLIERHGLIVNHQALDAMETGKVLKHGQWLPVTEIVATHLVDAGLAPVGRSWLADEDRQGLLVNGKSVNEDLWLAQLLISKGYEQGADNQWRPAADAVVKTPIAAPPIRESPVAETAETLALAQLHDEQGQWLAVQTLPGVPMPSANIANQSLANIGTDRRYMSVVANRSRPKPVTFTSATGLVGWRVAIAPGGQLGTPAISSKFVHVGGGHASSKTFAFDRLSGVPGWSVVLGDNGPSSPTLINDDVAYTTDSCTLYQLDGDTGKSLFARWISGHLLTMPGVIGTMLVTTSPLDNGFALVGFERSSGSKKHWATSLPSDLRTAPIAFGDRLIGVSNSGAVMCWNTVDGQELWRDHLGAISPPSSVNGRIMIRRAMKKPAKGGLLYGETLTLLDPRDGTMVESMMGAPCSLYVNDSLSTSDPTPLMAVGATVPSYPALGPAVSAQGVSVAVRGDVLEAITVKNGLRSWQVQLGRTASTTLQTHSDPCIAGTCVVIGTLDGQLLAIDLATGAQRWSAQLGAPIGNADCGNSTMCRVRPVVQEGRVYITTSAGELVCLDTGDQSLNGARWWGDAL